MFTFDCSISENNSLEVSSQSVLLLSTDEYIHNIQKGERFPVVDCNLVHFLKYRS